MSQPSLLQAGRPEYEQLSLQRLGNKVEVPTSYAPDILEFVPFPERSTLASPMWVSLETKEFTSLCPVTKQADFASIWILYLPHKKIVESKSLKLYLASFRNEPVFQETLVDVIANDLFKGLNAHYLEVYAEFQERGGILIRPFAQRSQFASAWESFAKSRVPQAFSRHV